MTESITENRGPRIFLNYRREDSGFEADSLYAHLVDHFGSQQVFKDIESIELGHDFVDAISGSLTACDCLIAVIGPRWLELLQARLSDMNDFVRMEISIALDRGIRVIPVLFGGAELPEPRRLPASIASLTRRQALTISTVADFERLVGALRTSSSSLPRQKQNSSTAPQPTINETERVEDRKQTHVSSASYSITSSSLPRSIQGYSGRVFISVAGAGYRLKWEFTNASPYHGIALTEEKVLAVGWGSPRTGHGVAIYRRTADHSLVGRWAMDEQGTGIINVGTERLEASPGSVSASDLQGKFRVAGVDPTGRKYSGDVSVARNGETYTLEWTVGTRSYRGTGILTGDVIAVGWGIATGVGRYRVTPSGLVGTWAHPGGSNLGAESLALE
ncbi:toll/interleukin-1 receptor domain-containing protein [Pseudonocardia xinjiangensis]|uniref:toll/interleukin-1 receptor domain-containing protein n=1 Tax=Pseudonocardia xinjiangensis TaxID=75289 RepID=UPI003D934EAD